MKVFSSTSNSYLIRILDDVSEDLIKSYLANKNSYISSYNPYIEIEGPDIECDDVMEFLDDNDIRYNIY